MKQALLIGLVVLFFAGTAGAQPTPTPTPGDPGFLGELTACPAPPCDTTARAEARSGTKTALVKLTGTATVKLMCDFCTGYHCVPAQIGSDITTTSVVTFAHRCEGVFLRITAYTSGAVLGWVRSSK